MRLWLVLLVILLSACSDVSAPAQLPATPTPLSALPLGELLARVTPSADAQVSVAGYLVVDDAGARLLDGLSFSAGATPAPLSGPAAQIWLGPATSMTLGGALRQAGRLRYAVVVARGRLEGPGAYGPADAYHYRMSDPRLDPIAPIETSVAQLLDSSAAYQGQLVRVVGSLLTRSDSALLVDRLGEGGLPQPGARQIKLRGPLRDTALLEHLRGAPGGAVRFGQVQVEGFWREGQLTPLAFLPVS